mgnify:CR=1 FL=1
MGKVVGAALLAHVPTIMLPETVRKDLNNGQEISLVPGLKKLRKDVFDVLDYDTVVVLDSHWATTVEFVITSAAERSGLFTSEELPRGMSQIPYSIKGDPELANSLSKYDEKNGTPEVLEYLLSFNKLPNVQTWRKLDFNGQTLIPFSRFQYYDGGKKHELDARSYEVKELEIGAEWQPNKNFELVVMYTMSARRFEDAANPVNYQRGNLLRIQAQVNF